MKKRKPPILLISILVVMVGAVAVMNGPSSQMAGDGHGHGEAPQGDDSQVLTPGRATTDSKENLAAMVKAKVGATKKQRTPEGDEVKEPVIIAPTPAKYIPKPGESPTASQWHRKESLSSTVKN